MIARWLARVARYLVPDWRSAWRWLSVQFAALLVAWSLVPPDAQASLLATVGVPPQYVPAMLGALIILGRLVAQRERRDDGQGGGA